MAEKSRHQPLRVLTDDGSSVEKNLLLSCHVMTQETYNTALGPINHLHKKGKVAFKSRGTLILLTFQDLQTNIQFNTSCRGKNVPIILQIISEGREATLTREEVICCILQQCVSLLGYTEERILKNLLEKYYYQH